MDEKLCVLVGNDTLNIDAVNIAKYVKPEWNGSRVGVKVFTDGITNRLVGCYVDDSSGDTPDDMILIRVYGENTHLFIDRNLEIRNLKLMHAAGLSPPLFCTFDNGICYGYTPGEVLNEKSVRDPPVCKMITKNLAFMHSITLDCSDRSQVTEPCLFKVLRRYLQLIPDSCEYKENFSRHIPNKQQLSEEVDFLEKHLSIMGSPVVFCHNDLLLKNIIRNRSKGVTFIDFEYADFNYQAFDIGNHFCEFAGVEKYNPSLYPDKDFQMEWLRSYVLAWNHIHSRVNNVPKQAIDDQIEKLYVQVNKFSLAAHLLWGIWALIQARHSTICFDFVGYAVDRIQEYFKRKPFLLLSE